MGALTPQTFVSEEGARGWEGWSDLWRARCGAGGGAKCRSGALLFLRLGRRVGGRASDVVNASFVPTCEVGTDSATFEKLPRYLKDAAAALLPPAGSGENDGSGGDGATIAAIEAYRGTVSVPAVGGVCDDSAAFVRNALAGLGVGAELDAEVWVRDELLRSRTEK